MIESTLFFILGFLGASFLALMIAPAIWRRAVNLTRRRIEATVPLTRNEIEAGKDRLRAEHAMSMRRMEMTAASLRKKTAEQAVELARGKEELKRLAVEPEEKRATIATLETQSQELRAALVLLEERLQHANARRDEMAGNLEARAGEIARLNGLYDEAAFMASSRQIELVARDAEIDRLNSNIGQLNKGQREFERRLGQADNHHRNTAQLLAAEKKRVVDLEHKIERMLATIADREEKLERREKEIERLRHQAGGPAAPVRNAGPSARVFGKADEGRTEAAGRNQSPGNSSLRDEISELAAGVINMTIMLEGEDSSVARALAQPDVADAAARTEPSIADRVRILQKAAASR